ncbi:MULTISPECIES: hypothetical protein [unclassified Pseudodesulfovibrio]|nr:MULTISPECIES: hypothetical protein [unclassified Pseudodesulfovibrio]MCJ2166179.1 hypothetical protein [Pseudodesulfovibrio sp. S3-i]
MQEAVFFGFLLLFSCGSCLSMSTTAHCPGRFDAAKRFTALSLDFVAG